MCECCQPAAGSSSFTPERVCGKSSDWGGARPRRPAASDGKYFPGFCRRSIGLSFCAVGYQRVVETEQEPGPGSVARYARLSIHWRRVPVDRNSLRIDSGAALTKSGSIAHAEVRITEWEQR